MTGYAAQMAADTQFVGIAEEIVWRDDWLGSYRAVRVIDGVKIEITVTATEATA